MHPASKSLSEEPSPRAIAIGTGLVFVVVGSGLFLGSCVLWSLSGFWIASESPYRVSGSFGPSEFGWSKLLTAATILLTFLGGMSVFAAGVGLYGERPSAGPLSVCVTVILALMYWTDTALIATIGEGRLWAVIPAGLAILVMLLIPLAVLSCSVLRRFPPPPNRVDPVV